MVRRIESRKLKFTCVIHPFDSQFWSFLSVLELFFCKFLYLLKPQFEIETDIARCGMDAITIIIIIN